MPTLAILAVLLDGYRSTHKENKVTLTGCLPSSSSQNSLPGSEVAGSSQNPMTGGAAFSSWLLRELLEVTSLVVKLLIFW